MPENTPATMTGPIDPAKIKRKISFLWGEGLTDLVLGKTMLQKLGVLSPQARTGHTGGCDAFWKLSPVMNRLAQSGHLVLGLTDLDDWASPNELLDSHFPQGINSNFLLRVPIVMLESWALADIKGMAQYLQVDEALLPRDAQTIRMPKVTIVELARQSANQRIATDIAPPLASRARVGRGYTTHLLRFTETVWDPWRAMQNNESLRKAVDAITTACTTDAPAPASIDKFTEAIFEKDPPTLTETDREDELKTPRKMPKFDYDIPGDTWFVTLFLADAIPLEYLKKMQQELLEWMKKYEGAELTAALRRQRNELFPQRIENFLDKGEGSCLFNDTRMARAAQESLEHYNGRRYNLGRYAIMPNHIHAVLTLPPDGNITRVIRTIKHSSGDLLNKLTGLSSGTPVWHQHTLTQQVRNVTDLAKANQVIFLSQ
ncbi:MAG: transposase [Candidatus Sumerlaeales bacterium]|nr:transposase [Candidatus Sumerlaeales bacterium]